MGGPRGGVLEALRQLRRHDWNLPAGGDTGIVVTGLPHNQYEMSTRILTIHELADELPRVLDFARTDGTYHAIVDWDGYYVQFAILDDCVLAEAVSNEYLEGERQMPEHSEVLLDILGWERPGAVDGDGDGHRNFHRVWHRDTPSEVIADDVLRTLTGVYMADEDGTVDLDLFACDYCESHAPNERAFGDGDSDDDEPEGWRCGRCATVNDAVDAVCNGCGLGKEASVW